jgi:chemotaxis protein CheD
MTQIMIGIADYAVADAPAQLVTNGIGSCVAIALYDRVSKIGALAHILLPHELLSAAQQPPAKSASTAVPRMVTRMREMRSAGQIEARLIGGASMFAPLLIPGALSLGARNILAARAACTAADIPVVGEDVGGDHGRSVTFRLDDGSVLVHSIAKGDVQL